MVSFLSTNSCSGRSKAIKLFFDLAVAINEGVATTRIYIIDYSTITPPTARLRLLLVVVSFPFSFQFFTRLAAVFAEEVGDCFMPC